MVGAISLYNPDGERQHTMYFAAPSQYGKASFKARYEYEIQRLKEQYPKALYLGIADGAKDNWGFLTSHTDQQLLGFYDAKILHSFLEVGRAFNAWISNRIKMYGFIENQDFTMSPVSSIVEPIEIYNASYSKARYHLTLELAMMVERNDKGQEARRYFINCEKQLNKKQLPHHNNRKPANKPPQCSPKANKSIKRNPELNLRNLCCN